jgi:replicative DNA helicase
LLELKETDNEKTFSGYRSGFEDLNIMTQGFQKSDLIILAGRPSMGKTAFALNITLDLLLNYNNPIIFFSLEMPKSQLMYRLLSIDSEISTSRLKLGNLNDEEWQIINASIKKLSSLNLYIDDTSNISISEIRFKIQKIQAQFKNLGAVIVDYLQLLETSKKIENRVQEISKITRNLKGFAKEFNIPIIVLSQLSRNVESRKNKRPILSDLRESGCIHLKNSQIITYSRKLFYLISYENNKKNFQKTSSFIFKFSGLKPVFILKNDSKLPLYLTSNHKILSTNNWRRVDEINSLSFINSNLFLPIYNSKINSMIYQLIKKIRYIGLKDVYDLEISNSKTFFYNQFILHNSIEQDADIVLMLYRDEYYNEKSSEENIVELIIAKHRNGPVGTIKLLFDNYLTKFFNFS